jgi:hypothetical protein
MLSHFTELEPQALGLMTDVFGNYVIQKLFEFGTEEQKTTLCNLLRGKVVNMSMQMYGCRTVQKAIEVLKEDMQLDIVRELKGSVQRYGITHGLKSCARGEWAALSRIFFSCLPTALGSFREMLAAISGPKQSALSSQYCVAFAMHYLGKMNPAQPLRLR